MMPRILTALLAATVFASPIAARAACFDAAQAAPSLSLEAGASNDSLSGNRTAWHETYVEADARSDAKRSVYARAARDERFGFADNVYEAGGYAPLLPNVEANAFASFSPQHSQEPVNTIGGGLDVRSGGGYGVQAGYAERNYAFERAAIVDAGGDRYFGRDRVAVVLTFATLSNAPGTAMSETLQFGRYLTCDRFSAAMSFGRDVENIAPGSIAVYPTRSYDVDEMHWFTNRIGVDAGMGWTLLGGAYSRMEVRFAVRERI